jgi:hypothetical protein
MMIRPFFDVDSVSIDGHDYSVNIGGDRGKPG